MVPASDSTSVGAAVLDDRTVTRMAEAEGKWEPADIVESGGKAIEWTSSGTGGTDYDLLSVSGPTDPTYAATANRAGGPAVRLVRASATKLATIAFTLNQPNTQLWILKLTNATDNQRLTDGRTGNTRSFYQWSNVMRLSCGAEISFAETSTGWEARAAVANGVSSLVRVGAASATGNAGTNAASGIVLGDFGTGGGAAADGDIERGFFWTEALSDQEIVDIQTYFGLAA